MQYMTVQEFAEMTRMNYQTILRAIHSGKIYAIQFGEGKKSPYRISITELERLQIATKFKESK